MKSAIFLFVLGVALVIPLVFEYIERGLRLPTLGRSSHLAVTGLFSIVAGFMTFSSTLVLHSAAMRGRPRRR